jgi:hypothetical protein
VVHGFELCVDAGGVVNMDGALGITGDGKGHCIGFVVGPSAVVGTTSLSWATGAPDCWSFAPLTPPPSFLL